MAKAEVKVSITPRQHNLIVAALEALRDENKDLVEDPVVKEEDKQAAREEWGEIEFLLNSIR